MVPVTWRHVDQAQQGTSVLGRLVPCQCLSEGCPGQRRAQGVGLSHLHQCQHCSPVAKVLTLLLPLGSQQGRKESLLFAWEAQHRGQCLGGAVSSQGWRPGPQTAYGEGSLHVQGEHAEVRVTLEPGTDTCLAVPKTPRYSQSHARLLSLDSEPHPTNPLHLV